MAIKNATTLEQNLSVNLNNVHHASDELGVMVGLERLHGENVKDYRDRIGDVFVRPAGGDLLGLIYGMNRQLGFVAERALTISLRDNVDVFVGPKIDVSATAIKLYSSWDVNGNSTLEFSIDIFSDFATEYHDYNAKYLVEVHDIINTNSSVFEASLAHSSYSYYLASGLIPTTSTKLAIPETVSNQFHRLNHDLIIPDSIVLSDSQIYKHKLVDMLDWDTSISFTGPTDVEEYWVDLEQGIVLLGQHPGNLNVGYMYNELPLTIYFAPIELYPFTDKDFNQLLSDVRLDAYGNATTYIPTSQGVKWINKLYVEAKHFWGGNNIYSSPRAATPSYLSIVDTLIENVDTSNIGNVSTPNSNLASYRNVSQVK